MPGDKEIVKPGVVDPFTTAMALVSVLNGLSVEPLPVVSLPVFGLTTNVVSGGIVGGIVDGFPRRVHAAVFNNPTTDTTARTAKNARTHHDMNAWFAESRAGTPAGALSF